VTRPIWLYLLGNLWIVISVSSLFAHKMHYVSSICNIFWSINFVEMTCLAIFHKNSLSFLNFNSGELAKWLGTWSQSACPRFDWVCFLVWVWVSALWKKPPRPAIYPTMAHLLRIMISFWMKALRIHCGK